MVVFKALTDVGIMAEPLRPILRSISFSRICLCRILTRPRILWYVVGCSYLIYPDLPTVHAPAAAAANDNDDNNNNNDNNDKDGNKDETNNNTLYIYIPDKPIGPAPRRQCFICTYDMI
jgi:hypothetical protein